MSNEKVLVNIIILTCDERRFKLLQKAVQSVLEQTYGRENIHIIISINGPDLEYKMQVERYFAAEKNIKCIYSSRGNAPAATNYAIKQLTEGYVIFLDDDDYLTKGYISLMCSYMDSDVDIVFGLKSTLKEDDIIDYDTYINRAIKVAGTGKRKISVKEEVLLSAYVCNLFRVNTIKYGFVPFDETLDFAFDTVYMLANFENIRGYVNVVDYNCKETYVIRETENSLSRNSNDKAFNYWISGRMNIIDKLTKIAFSAQNEDHLQLILFYYLQGMTIDIYKFYNGLDEKDKMRARRHLFMATSPFLDKSMFFDSEEQKLCHKFYQKNAGNIANLLKSNIREKNINNKLQQEISLLLNNKSFRLGRFITFLPRKIRDKIQYYHNWHK